MIRGRSTVAIPWARAHAGDRERGSTVDVINTVVIGVHDKQPIALGVAVDEALRSRGRLRVVHAADSPFPSFDPTVAGSADVSVYEAAGQVILDDAREHVEHVAPRLRVEYVLAAGEPLHVLEREASRASMLVVGSDRVPWFERLLRSRVAGTLARHAPCPVVVVPETVPSSGAESAVVLALDPDEPVRAAVRFAFRQADERGCALHVLPTAEPGTPAALPDKLSAALADSTSVYPHVRVLSGGVEGDVEDAIVRASLDAELVVVGRPRVNALQAFLAQPVSVRVVRRAGCPVAVVPDVGVTPADVGDG